MNDKIMNMSVMNIRQVMISTRLNASAIMQTMYWI